MSVAKNEDASTLASLEPQSQVDMRAFSYKASPRLQGSYLLSLRQPSRTPEFTRTYVPGDPVHRIDWKAYARTDQLILREHRDEAAAQVRLIVECHPAMAWPSADVPVPFEGEHPITKQEVALRVAFHLAYAHLRKGDFVTIWFQESDRGDLPRYAFTPRSPADVVSAFSMLEASQFIWSDLLPSLREMVFERRPCDQLWWLGDGLGSQNFADLRQDARSFAMIQTLSVFETSTAWLDSDVSYFDEGRALKEYRGQALKANEGYLTQLARWQTTLTRSCQEAGGDFLAVNETTPMSVFHHFITDAVKSL